jgi:hypothetical protein
MAEPELMFEFRLALALGRTVAELRQTVSSTELTYWVAFNQLEPLPEHRADVRNAIVGYTIARSMGSRGCTPEDFLPQFGDRKPTKNGVKLFAIWVEAHNSRQKN